MKPITTATIEHQLARHNRRAHRQRAFPATDYFFRPETDATLGRAPQRAADPARRAFRRMTAEMLATQNRRDPLEMIGLAIVTALIAWPLIDLLIVLAQTANG
jgi:hypothetical protein